MKRLVVLITLVFLVSLIMFITGYIASGTGVISNWSDGTRTGISIFWALLTVASLIVSIAISRDDIEILFK